MKLDEADFVSKLNSTIFMNSTNIKRSLGLLITVGSISSSQAQDAPNKGFEIPEPEPKLTITEADATKLANEIAAEKKAVKEAAELKAAEEAKAALEKARAEAKARGEVLPQDVKIPEKSSAHIIEPGGSLSLISAKVYSRPGYWRILKLHNGIAPEKLQAGQLIKAPNLNWLLEDCKFKDKYPEVSTDLMAARQLFMDVEDGLESSITNDTITPTEEDKQKIAEAISLIDKCCKTLKANKEGVRSSPSAAIMQLRNAIKRMVIISGGTKKAAQAQNIVHEHFSNSIVYAVLWARDGFK